MKARQSRCEGYRRSSMGTQTPKAAGSAASYMPSDFCSLPPTTAVDSRTDVMDAAGSWQNTISERADQQECSLQHGRRETLQGDDRPRTPCRPHTAERTIPDQLADLLIDAFGDEGAELGEAFQCASDQPPVTAQSLSELDISNIIGNIKLRHDINFDKDLSFRPNLDGPKGQEKRRHSDKYWRALVAELELYVLLFQRTPSCTVDQKRWDEFIAHAKRRIPKMFKTIHDVLKSLVPDRDHARVDEHFDADMLMQEIQRGVCDLVKRTEWLASLLKEHCAPMRDVMVDAMVEKTRAGVTTNNSTLIVNGLRELLGILEAMKLDVANHQIRNLKTLLIEETVNFEYLYHCPRIRKGRSKANREAAEKWWDASFRRFRRDPFTRDPTRRLEIFTQAVVSDLFASEGLSKLPDTFYLDQERLRLLKYEVDDLIHFEICFDMYARCLRDFGHHHPVPPAAQTQLRTALSAIIGEGIPHAPQSWLYHAESLSLEIYRQAIMLAGRHFTYNADYLQRAHFELQQTFQHRFSDYAKMVREIVLPQILSCTKKMHNASPSELFAKLVVPAPSPSSSAPSFIPPPPPPYQQYHNNTLSVSSICADRTVDLTNRISHILLLHWRIWSPITYEGDDNSASTARPGAHRQLPTPEQSPSPKLHAPFPKPAKGASLILQIVDEERGDMDEDVEMDISDVEDE